MDKEHDEMVSEMERQIVRKRELFEAYQLIKEKEKQVEERKKQIMSASEEPNEALMQKADKAYENVISAQNIVTAGLDSISAFSEKIDDERFTNYKTILQAKTADEMEAAIKNIDKQKKIEELKEKSNSVIDFCDSVIKQSQLLLEAIDVLLEEIDEELANTNKEEEDIKQTIDEEIESEEEMDITAIEEEDEEVEKAKALRALENLSNEKKLNTNKNKR